ncbi:unnamed protein product [Mycena citricolor]|uniref:Uncharacterized protein n=1 Tax=Mycena citricolor TaxID=2018698 RepID=A0AAD2JVN7_9AGAR|nr:unnamed protein product [Mycena citricolor]
MAGLNKNNSAVKRIMQERMTYLFVIHDYTFSHRFSLLKEWHCTLRGPSGTEFEGDLHKLHKLTLATRLGCENSYYWIAGFFPLKGKAAVGVGSIEHPVAERRRLAGLSRSWVCPHCAVPNSSLLSDPAEESSKAASERADAVDAGAPPNPVEAPIVAAIVDSASQPVPRAQRPPLLLDTAICVILVLVCGIVFRRVF